MGGTALRDAGLDVVVDAKDFLAMGFVEVLSRLPRAAEAIRELSRLAERERPDVAIVIDYPDFHFRLSQKLKDLGIPVVYYIPPKVWAWRKKRTQILKERFARVLSILPFEEEFLRSHGVPVTYVGNPLSDELPLNLTRVEARTSLSVEEGAKVLVLMPGSRPSELKRHTTLMLDGALRAAAELRRRGVLGSSESLVSLIPVPLTTSREEIEGRVAQWKKQMGVSEAEKTGRFILDIRVFHGGSHACLVAADAGLIKSGTSTLEAGLLGCPHAVVYRPHPISGWIFRNWVRYSGPVGLVNLASGGLGSRAPNLVRELLMNEATPQALAQEVVSLLVDLEKREKILQGMKRLRVSLFGGALKDRSSPSVKAAQEILSVVQESRDSLQAQVVDSACRGVNPK